MKRQDSIIYFIHKKLSSSRTRYYKKCYEKISHIFIQKEANNQVEGSETQMHKAIKVWEKKYDIYLSLLFKRNLTLSWLILVKLSLIPFFEDQRHVRVLQSKTEPNWLRCWTTLQKWISFPFYQIFIFYSSQITSHWYLFTNWVILYFIFLLIDACI